MIEKDKFKFIKKYPQHNDIKSHMDTDAVANSTYSWQANKTFKSFVVHN